MIVEYHDLCIFDDDEGEEVDVVKLCTWFPVGCHAVAVGYMGLKNGSVTQVLATIHGCSFGLNYCCYCQATVCDCVDIIHTSTQAVAVMTATCLPLL